MQRDGRENRVSLKGSRWNDEMGLEVLRRTAMVLMLEWQEGQDGPPREIDCAVLARDLCCEFLGAGDPEVRDRVEAGLEEIFDRGLLPRWAWVPSVEVGGLPG